MDSNLVTTKERYEHRTGYGDVLYITQYSNKVYTVFFTEENDKVYACIIRNDINYPTIFSEGINVVATGTLNPKELSEHIVKLRFAMDTYLQVLGLHEGITIK